MAKVKDNVFGVFGQSLELYFKNFGSFFKYMSFPVFGQIFGIILIVMASYFYSATLKKIVVPGGVFDNFSVIFFVLFLVTLPGLIILIKAFWDYLVAYGAVNSMLDNMLKSGKVYDFHAHTEVITRRSASFGSIWVILAVLGLLGAFPLLWVVAGILFVYFILVFQVFVYEPDKSPWGCFSRSLELVKGNFASTVGLMILIGALTYWLIPEITKYILNFLEIIRLIAIPVDAWTSQLPIKALNEILLKTPTAYQLTSLEIAKFFVETLLTYIITSLTLPLRVLCWGLWYKKLSGANKKTRLETGEEVIKKISKKRVEKID